MKAKKAKNPPRPFPSLEDELMVIADSTDMRHATANADAKQAPAARENPFIGRQ